MRHQEMLIIITLLALLNLSGCSAWSQFFDAKKEWHAKKDNLIGLTVDELKMCAGEPYKTLFNNGLAEMYYGNYQVWGTASSFCEIALQTDGKKVTNYRTNSANPGGFTKGVDLCLYTVEKCISEKNWTSEYEPMMGKLKPITHSNQIAQVVGAGQAGMSMAMTQVAANLNHNNSVAQSNNVLAAAQQSNALAALRHSDDSRSQNSKFDCSMFFDYQQSFKFINQIGRDKWMNQLMACVQNNEINMEGMQQALANINNKSTNYSDTSSSKLHKINCPSLTASHQVSPPPRKNSKAYAHTIKISRLGSQIKSFDDWEHFELKYTTSKGIFLYGDQGTNVYNRKGKNDSSISVIEYVRFGTQDQGGGQHVIQTSQDSSLFLTCRKLTRKEFHQESGLF